MEYFSQMMEGLRYMQTLTRAAAAIINTRGEPHLRNGEKSSQAGLDGKLNSALNGHSQADVNGSPTNGATVPGIKERENPAKLNGHKKTNGADSIAVNGTKPNCAAVEMFPDETDVHANGDNTVLVRPYRSSDRDAFCRLCCDTGFLGRPVDPLFQDRELFADLFTRPYLDYEPERVLVAEVQGEVAGYLLGSVRKHFNVMLMWSGLRTTLKMLLRLVTGRYGRHPRSRQFIRWLLTAGFREQPKHPRGAAHLHIQVDRRFRGRGVCRQLWERYEKELRELGMTECYGAFFSYPRRRPELAYTRYGFSVFDRRRTTMFQPEIREPVEVVCVFKKF